MTSARKVTRVQQLDAIDRHILDLLRRDGRTSVSDIARGRRALRGSGLPPNRAPGAYRGDKGLHGRDRRAAGRLTEVEAVYTIAGDPDALVRICADSVDHLQRAVNKVRRTAKVTATKTLIVMYSWTRTGEQPRI